jgi:hypothetical protein
MTERLRVQTPTKETIFLDQKPGSKRENGMFQTTWHCCMCCNPDKGTFKMIGL